MKRYKQPKRKKTNDAFIIYGPKIKSTYIYFSAHIFFLSALLRFFVNDIHTHIYIYSNLRTACKLCNSIEF